MNYETEKSFCFGLFSEMVEKKKKDPFFEDVQKWIKGLSDGTYGHQIETSTMRGIQLLKPQKGFLLCDMIIPHWLVGKKNDTFKQCESKLFQSTSFKVTCCISFIDTPSITVEITFKQ